MLLQLRSGRVGFLLCVLLSGCSRSATPPTTAASGTVTYKGAPVEGATVVFSPPAGGRPATGITDSQGRFKLTTFAAEDGAVPGDYQVTVTKISTADAAPSLTYEQMSELQSKGQAPTGGTEKNLLPDRYRSVATTDLSYTVNASGNTYAIELKD